MKLLASVLNLIYKVGDNYGMNASICHSVKVMNIAFVSLFASMVAANAAPIQVKIDGNDYFALRSAEDVVWFRDYVNAGDAQANAILMKSVDLSAQCQGGWVAIAKKGSYSENTTWNGTFDGNGNVISGININTKEDNVGFFGFIGGTVKNLTLEGNIKCQYGYVAAVAAYSRGLIQNCINKVNIQCASAEKTGGLGGIVSRSAGKENGCINKGELSLPTDLLIAPKDHIVGGIVAVKTEGDITNCINYGTITSVSAEIGGIVGFCQSRATTVASCLSAGIINIDKTWQEHIGALTSSIGETPNCSNNYYLPLTQYAKSDKCTLVTKREIKTGKVTYLLQGESADYVWGQQMGKDFEPVFTSDEKKHLFKVDYHLTWNDTNIERFVNKGARVRLPIATDVFDNLDGSTWYDLSFEYGSRTFDINTLASKDMSIDVTCKKVELGGNTSYGVPAIVLPPISKEENVAKK